LHSWRSGGRRGAPAPPSGGDGKCGGGLCVAPWANAREERSKGRQAGLWPCMHASWLGQLGHGARAHGVWLAMAAERPGPTSGNSCAGHECVWSWAWPRWPTRGPCRDDVRTAGGVGPARALARRRRCDVTHRTRAPAFWPYFQFTEASFDRLKLKNFELKFKFAKNKSCRPDNPLQLS
jgi:hypothetical protein